MEILKPYEFHGLVFRVSGKEAIANCPFCEREKKFSVNTETGQYRCLVCAEGTKKGGGNSVTFIRKLHEHSLRNTTNHHKKKLESLAREKGIEDLSSLLSWGVCFSTISDLTIIPAYSTPNKLSQLYRYSSPTPKKKPILMATTGFKQALFGLHLFDPKKKFIYLCEGVWDAIALWEILKSCRLVETDNGKTKLQFTSNIEKSLYAQCNVLATPGCGSFSEEWSQYFEGKVVNIMYDNDHPKVVNGEEKDPASIIGVRRIADILSIPGHNPKSIRYLEWGPGGYTKDFPSGYDLRDHVKDEVSMAARIAKFSDLKNRLKPIPTNWVEGRSVEAHKTGSPVIESKECTSWKVLRNACKKALKWTDELDTAFSCMLACNASTTLLGDQLWIKIIGPASCGKSTLCEALSVNKEYVIAKSTIRGFHSGYKTDDSGDEDNSLIAVANGKTLVTKDGDTLLKTPNKEQILSEARDLYDRVARVHYRNKISRDYEHTSMTWILCGTSGLQALDSSDLGERFLTIRIMETIEESVEDDILHRQSYSAWNAMNYEANGEAESRHSPEKLEFMQLTGGYVSYLRNNILELTSKVTASEEALHYCTRLAKMVAYLRARPSKTQEEFVERELSARLTSQLLRLGRCLCVVLNKPELDEEVLRKLTKISIDTCKGRTYDIARWLYKENVGVEVRSISIWINETDDKIRALLRFMRKIGVVDVYQNKVGAGAAGRPKWKLSATLRKLFDAIGNYL